MHNSEPPGVLRGRVLPPLRRLVRRLLPWLFPAVAPREPGCRFSQVNVFYNLAFDLGHPVNPVDAARQLLKADFAGGFQNYDTGRQEIADRYRYHSVQYNKYLEARQALREMDSGAGPRPFLKLLLSDPRRWGPILIRGFRRTRSEENEGPDTTSMAEGDESGKVGHELTESAAEFALALLGRLAIQESVDRTIFHEDYLSRLPFTRISLQPFQAELASGSVDFAVTVTIHRSGIAILATHGSFSRGMGLREIIELQPASMLPICGCEIPASIIKRYYLLSLDRLRERDLKTFNEECVVENRPEYLRFEVEDDTVLAAILDAYRYSIIEAVQGKEYASLKSLHQSLRSRQYFGYPVIFARYRGAKTEKDFRSQHAESLAKLVLGFRGSSRLKQDRIKEICDGDLSIADDHSLYLTEGSATALYYGESASNHPLEPHGAEWLHKAFMTTVVLDALILQRMILALYDMELDQISLDMSGLKRLNAIRRELLLALEEFEILGLSHYGSVHDLIQRGQEILRIKDMYEAFIQRIETIEDLTQVAESRRKATQDQFSRTMATLISALLSLPIAHAIVNIISNWAPVLYHAYPLWIQAPFSWIVEHVQSYPVLSTILLYLSILILTLIAAWGPGLASLLTRRKKHVVPARQTVTSTARTFSPIALTVEKTDPASFTRENTIQEG